MPSRYLDTLVTTSYFPAITHVSSIDLNIQFKDALFNHKIFKNSIFEVSGRGLRKFDSSESKWKNLTRLVNRFIQHSAFHFIRRQPKFLFKGIAKMLNRGVAKLWMQYHPRSFWFPINNSSRSPCGHPINSQRPYCRRSL